MTYMQHWGQPLSLPETDVMAHTHNSINQEVEKGRSKVQNHFLLISHDS